MGTIELQTGFTDWRPVYPGLPAWEPKLKGLCGPARCGKDTTAGLLKKAFPNTIQTAAFADPIRDALRAMFGLTDEHFFGSLKEVEIPWLGVSPRKLMQTLGTEWGRGLVREDLWLLLCDRKIDAIHEAHNHAIITDVRFENEATRIRQRGGAVWHIRRTDAPAIQGIAGHQSEAGVVFRPDLGDIEIFNNGSIDALFDEVWDKF